MHRFFLPPEALSGDFATLTGEDAAHALRVLRLRPGDELALCDGADHQYAAVVTECGKDFLKARLSPPVELHAEPKTRITLYQAFPKGDKMELVLQKGTELGVAAFVPFVSLRCVSRPKGDKSDRLARVIYEAAKQSGRGALPSLSRPLSFDEFLSALEGHALALLAWEEKGLPGLRQALEASAAADIALIIGPEGGFAPEEAEAMRAHGAQAVTLGPRILRTETAGLAMAAATLFQRGEMDGSQA